MGTYSQLLQKPQPAIEEQEPVSSPVSETIAEPPVIAGNIAIQQASNITDNIVSNIAYNSSLIFFVTIPDNRLWAVDKDSFMKVGWIEFNGAPIERGNYYNVVANEDKVVVYMADSQQLVAFDLQIAD